MIRKGPSTRLKKAAGPTPYLDQLLAHLCSDADKGLERANEQAPSCLKSLWFRRGRRALGSSSLLRVLGDQGGEHLVECRSVFAARLDGAAGTLDRVIDAGRCDAGVLRNYEQLAWTALRDRHNTLDRRQDSDVERSSSADGDHLATQAPGDEGPPAESQTRSARPREIRATVSQYSASVTYCVVTIVVTPAMRMRSSSCQMRVRRSGSMPAVGSSRISRLG